MEYSVPQASEQAVKELLPLLSAFLNEALPELPAKYQWRVPPVPGGYISYGTSNLEQNLSVRSHLSARWQAGANRERLALATWYVRNWGGVKRNKPETLKAYAEGESANIIAGQGIRGIASWSKILVLRDPSKFLIYDARVAVSLNAMQIAYGSRAVVRFPAIASQNKIIRGFWSEVRVSKDWTDVPVLSEAEVYQSYLALLDQTRGERARERNWHLYEMALFAFAEEMAVKAMPGLASLA